MFGLQIFVIIFQLFHVDKHHPTALLKENSLYNGDNTVSNIESTPTPVMSSKKQKLDMKSFASVPANCSVTGKKHKIATAPSSVIKSQSHRNMQHLTGI